VVNVLLQELDRYTGVVIFATNLAANFDPAFERRIRTHVLFELPGETERVRIWKVQLHPSRTPLAPDVDFKALARQYEVSGGDIQNAVLKTALAAAAEPIPDSAKEDPSTSFPDGHRTGRGEQAGDATVTFCRINNRHARVRCRHSSNRIASRETVGVRPARSSSAGRADRACGSSASIAPTFSPTSPFIAPPERCNLYRKQHFFEE
jgi:SpoVK/Ycf46/Vps4 family AAA+-type ATPase